MGLSLRSSTLHNWLLLAAGATVGCAGTLAVQYFLGDDRTDEVTLIETVPEKSGGRSPSRLYGTADRAVKLSQIVAANDREHKADDLRRLGKETAGANKDEALTLAGNLKGEADRVAFMKGVMEAMAERDPAGAAAFAKANLPTGAQQAEAMRIALGAWGATNPRDAYAWAEANLSGPVKEESINALVQSWAGNSPEAAARWFEQTGSTSQPLLASLAGAWAAKNPRGAASWVETLPDSGNRDTGRVAVASEWAAQNPEEAASHYEPVVTAPQPEATATPSGLDLATVLADIWGASNPSAAAQWIAKLPAGPGREQAAGTLATVWAASDIDAAVQWSTTLTDPSIRSAVVDHIATTWGAIEPDKALAWLDTQPPGLTASGYRGAWNSWASTDPAGLQEWIAGMSPGPAADLARRSLGDVMLAREPIAALETALGIADSSQQSDALTRYYRQLLRIDPASAGEWLQTEANRIPATIQAKLMQDQPR